MVQPSTEVTEEARVSFAEAQHVHGQAEADRAELAQLRIQRDHVLADLSHLRALTGYERNARARAVHIGRMDETEQQQLEQEDVNRLVDGLLNAAEHAPNQGTREAVGRLLDNVLGVRDIRGSTVVLQIQRAWAEFVGLQGELIARVETDAILPARRDEEIASIRASFPSVLHLIAQHFLREANERPGPRQGDGGQQANGSSPVSPSLVQFVSHQASAQESDSRNGTIPGPTIYGPHAQAGNIDAHPFTSLWLSDVRAQWREEGQHVPDRLDYSGASNDVHQSTPLRHPEAGQLPHAHPLPTLTQSGVLSRRVESDELAEASTGSQDSTVLNSDTNSQGSTVLNSDANSEPRAETQGSQRGPDVQYIPTRPQWQIQHHVENGDGLPRLWQTEDLALTRSRSQSENYIDRMRWFMRSVRLFLGDPAYPDIREQYLAIQESMPQIHLISDRTVRFARAVAIARLLYELIDEYETRVPDPWDWDVRECVNTARTLFGEMEDIFPEEHRHDLRARPRRATSLIPLRQADSHIHTRRAYSTSQLLALRPAPRELESRRPARRRDRLPAPMRFNGHFYRNMELNNTRSSLAFGRTCSFSLPGEYVRYIEAYPSTGQTTGALHRCTKIPGAVLYYFGNTYQPHLGLVASFDWRSGSVPNYSESLRRTSDSRRSLGAIRVSVEDWINCRYKASMLDRLVWFEIDVAVGQNLISEELAESYWALWCGSGQERMAYGSDASELDIRESLPGHEEDLNLPYGLM